MNESSILVKCGRVTARIGCHQSVVSIEFGQIKDGQFAPSLYEKISSDQHPELKSLYDGAAWDAHELLLLVDKYCRDEWALTQEYLKRQMKKYGLTGKIEGESEGNDVHDQD